MNLANEKGNVIAYTVIAIAAVSALVVGMFYMNTSSTLGEIGARNENRAYSLALAGKYYAVINNLSDNTGTNGQDFVLDSITGDKFHLLITGTCPQPVAIESIGIVNFNTPYEARRKISINTCP